MTLTLKQHQVEGIAWLRERPRALLADSPRAGKTACLLLASEGRTLVIAPAHLEGTWRREHAIWTPNLDMTFVSYSSVAMRAPNEHGHMRKTLPMPKPEYREFDTVLCDEAHMLVNTKAHWTGAVARIHSDRFYMATGTPIPNWATELLMPLRLLYPGDRRFTNRRVWEDKWFDWWEPPWGGRQLVVPPASWDGPKVGITWPFFWDQNGLDGEHGRMLQRDVDLGVPYTEEDIEVDMRPSQSKVYKQLAKEYVAWTENNEEISAWSDGGLHTKLMQVATGLEVLADQTMSSGKFDVLRQLLEDAPRSKTLVFTHYRETARLAYEIAKEMGLRAGLIRGGVSYEERDYIEAHFNDGELDVVVGTLDTIAVGLNLAGASTEIFLEHGYSAWRLDQALKRGMEFGKKTHVHVVHLWTKGTVDIGTRALVRAKDDHQLKALTARQFRGVIYG